MKKSGVANRPEPIHIKKVLKNDPKIKIKILPKENQKKGGSPSSEKKPTTAETLKKATEAAVAEQKKKKGSDGVIGKKRRRRLMSIDTGRLSMHELRELKDEFLAEKDTAKRQEIWKKKVLKLDDDLQKKFQSLLDGEEVDDGEEDDDEDEDDEAKLVRDHVDHDHHDDGSRHDRSGDIAGRAPEDHPHYVGHTEGCLIYGAVAAEKFQVPCESQQSQNGTTLSPSISIYHTQCTIFHSET